MKRAGSTSSQKNIRSTIPVDDSDEDNKSLGHRSLRENSLTANKNFKCPGLSQQSSKRSLTGVNQSKVKH